MGWGGRVALVAMRRRRVVVFLSLTLTAASLVSLTRLRLDVDLLETLPTGEAAFDEYRDFLGTFGETQSLLVLLSGARGPALARAIDNLGAQLRALPGITSVFTGLDRPDAAPYLDPTYAAALVPAERFSELAVRLEPESVRKALERAKRLLVIPAGPETTEHIRRDPLGLVPVVAAAIRDRYADPASGVVDRHILTPGGDAGLILIRPAGSPFDGEFTAALFEALVSVENKVRNAEPTLSGLRVQYAGAYAHAYQDQRLLRGDMIRYTMLALIGVIIIFQLGYRNPAILPLIGYPLISGSLLTFAASALIYQRLNALSLSFAAIFYGLAIDSGIHFYSRLLAERRNTALESALVRTCDGIARSNVAASITTAAAFAVIAFSAIGAVSQIGVLTALGMIVNIGNTFIVLPALTLVFPGRLAHQPPIPHEAPWLAALTRVLDRHRRLVLGIAVGVAITWLASGRSVPVDAEVRHLRPVEAPATVAENEIEARFGGLVPRGVAIVTGADLEDALAREERVVDWLQTRRHSDSAPAVSAYQALSTFLPSQATERARRSAFTALPLEEARSTLREELTRQGFRPQAFADAERALAPEPLPRALEAAWLEPLLARHLHRSRGGVQLAVFFFPEHGTGLGAVRDLLHADVDPGVVVTGRTLMQEKLATLIRREVVVFTAATLALNTAIVLLQFRALGLALAVMAPTTVLVLALLAGMQLTGAAFTPVSLVVLPLTLGIGVDHCLYVTERFREGHDASSAMRLVGRAITLATLTTMTGFGFLAVSRYPALAGLGWLAALAIGLTFVVTVVFLPAFLALTRASRATSHPLG